MKIYLIGVDHSSQSIGALLCDKFKSLQKKLFKVVHRFIEEDRIHFLAEEYSQKALNKHSEQKTVLQIISEEKGINHLFCDPEPEQRKELRILEEGENEHAPREEFWLDRIKSISSIAENIIFVCGYDHLDSFSTLCSTAGYDLIIEKII